MNLAVGEHEGEDGRVLGVFQFPGIVQVRDFADFQIRPDGVQRGDGGHDGRLSFAHQSADVDLFGPNHSGHRSGYFGVAKIQLR